MKKIIAVLFSFLMIGTTCCYAADFRDYEFQQERMKLSSDAIFIISSFDFEDHITAYSYYGVRLWDATFHAKILSWEVADDIIIVFSKDHNGHKTFLTCINQTNGQMIWQK